MPGDAAGQCQHTVSCQPCQHTVSCLGPGNHSKDTQQNLSRSKSCMHCQEQWVSPVHVLLPCKGWWRRWGCRIWRVHWRECRARAHRVQGLPALHNSRKQFVIQTSHSNSQACSTLQWHELQARSLSCAVSHTKQQTTDAAQDAAQDRAVLGRTTFRAGLLWVLLCVGMVVTIVGQSPWAPQCCLCGCSWCGHQRRQRQDCML